jgi:hypothetical protein
MLIWDSVENVGAIYGNTLFNLTDTKMNKQNKPDVKYVNPYPDYNSPNWKKDHAGAYQPCDGPDGQIQDAIAYQGHHPIFQSPPIGSYSTLNIDHNLCFERESRLHPYGYIDDSEEFETLEKRRIWEDVKWGQMQDQCAQKNWNRFLGSGKSNWKREDLGWRTGIDETPEAELSMTPTTPENGTARSAVVIRVWEGKEFTEDDKQTTRSLITELNLRSGGEYQVFLLMHIKNNTHPFWDNETIYRETIQENVPSEFWDMTVLWSEAKMREWYPLVPEDGTTVHQAQYFPVQKFAQEHPEFEYIWNWEIDSRYTGHNYDLLEKLAVFSKHQPRKYLWERNERYYIPSIHGDYNTAFRKSVEESAPVGDTVWGPAPLVNITPTGPLPPVPNPSEDAYSWGVNEEADYISLAPIFNPEGSEWILKDNVWGYTLSSTPRRTNIGTQSRLSRRLLNAMHIENLKGNQACSEMTAATVALLHGFKAVFAPIPVFFDRAWRGESLQKYFNPDEGRGGGSGGQDSAFGWGNERRFNGSTWYYRATPPQRLYNNWLGWEDSGIGGPDVRILSVLSLHLWSYTNVLQWEHIYGKTCLPPLLLHPVKDVVKPPPGYSSVSST